MGRVTLLSLLALTAIAAGCAQREPQVQAIEAAAEALGGAEAVRNAATLAITGQGTQYRLGQNRSPDSELPEATVQSFKREWDLANRRVRTEITANNFLGQPVTQVTGVDGDVAYGIGADGNAQRLGQPNAAERQAEYYHHPLTILHAALSQGEGAATVTNLRREGGNDLIDVNVGGRQLTLSIDTQTRLPVAVSSRSYNPNLGDVVISTSFSDYVESGGLRLPQTITQRIDEFPALDLRVTSTLNEAPGDLSAPAQVASAPEPGPQPANVTSEELAPGVWRLAGQSHHSVLVEFPQYTVLVEAPQNDTRTLAVIAKARELVPGKPLRYVVNTHHHFDHSGGLRAAVAEGLTVITHEINRPLFERLVQRPHTLVQDHLAKNPKPLMLETVRGDEKFELRDGNQALEIHRIKDDTHNDGILMVYLPGPGLLIQADVYTPGRPAAGAPNLVKNIGERRLRVNRVVPIHGDVVPYSELQKAAQEAPRT